MGKAWRVLRTSRWRRRRIWAVLLGWGLPWGVWHPARVAPGWALRRWCAAVPRDVLPVVETYRWLDKRGRGLMVQSYVTIRTHRFNGKYLFSISASCGYRGFGFGGFIWPQTVAYSSLQGALVGAAVLLEEEFGEQACVAWAWRLARQPKLF